MRIPKNVAAVTIIFSISRAGAKVESVGDRGHDPRPVYQLKFTLEDRPEGTNWLRGWTRRSRLTDSLKDEAMIRFLIAMCLIACLACSIQSQVRNEHPVDRNGSYVADELSTKLHTAEFEQFPPPPAWKKDAGKTITFVATRAPNSKGYPLSAVRVGKYVLDVRGGGLKDVPVDAAVRITGVIQCVQHPGDPKAWVQQQGSTEFRLRPWNEWFVDATKVEVLSNPD